MAQTEEEQIAQFKNWWKENGNSIIIGVLLALALTGGWRFWQHSQIQQKEQAAVIYDSVLRSLGANVDNVAIVEQINSLTKEYGSLGYAQYGNLLLAKIAVEEGKPNEAVDLLRSLIANSKDQHLKQLAITRIARILLDLKQYDEALQVLAQTSKVEVYGAYQEELKGDVLFAQGKLKEAKESYLNAQKLNKDAVDSAFLQTKIDDLADSDS